MLEQMKTLVRENDICVLATSAGGKPYCSLMAYVSDESCDEIYMVTHRHSHKYQNMMRRPAVSLLIDTRESSPRSGVQALTVEGSFCRIEGGAKRNVISRLLLRAHPYLGDLINHTDAELFYIKPSAFLLLNGISEVHFQEL